ncbi:integral membrane protein TIGR01906 [Clostridium collagenovorans DSM 3089]|uniref:Integral membrane protein TIGR01906 n=1 Tax=Clostridium collagenovorans DSM 3089 TaxID=1121306 RepID=A0A1M5VXA6_9CLOT|nr:integral membrane protein TIGR01906 [Clostridium collagenovorans DSM 3089]
MSYKKFYNIFSPFILTITIILITINLIILYKPLYYVKIDSLNLTNFNSKENIIRNYDYIIDYLYDFPKNNKGEDFNLPTLPSSPEGKSHFKDVQKLIFKMNLCLGLSSLLSAIIVMKSIKDKYFKILKHTSLCLILLPIALVLPILINFHSSFTLFHKLFFNNSNWLFDSQFDPIIKLLPQNFFLYMSICIIGSLIFISITLYVSYTFINIRNKRKDYALC